MEASEKPQLPLDTDAPEGAVRAIGDRLVIESLTINDERSARVVRQRAESGQGALDTIAKAIEIGARVLDREEVAAEVDYVKREFERLASEHREQLEAKNREAAERIEAEIRRAFGSDEAQGALTAALEGHSASLSEQLAELFDEGRDTAVQARIKATLEERDRAFLDRLSADDELNPIRPLLSTVRGWAKERREDQDARDQKLEQKLDQVLKEAAELAGLQQRSDELEAAIEAGTQKGCVFEDAVHDEIDRIASAGGDAAHHVGAVSNEAGSKKGDTLVEIGGANGPAKARVIFEAKDKKLSRNDAWQELNAELEGRDASFAVLVVSGPGKVPSRTQELHEYQGNKMVVVFDKETVDPFGLELVYRYACARALMGSEGELEVDAAGISALVERARAALKRGKGVRDSLTRAQQGIEGARDGFDAIVKDVDDCLEQAESLIAPSAAD
ncbi:MAG: hypothetical protein ACRDK5_02530 [Solirubrobacterales bacterium]